jgi:hypothetical protein
MSGEMSNMSEYYVFISRLKLLIVMLKAYLNGCPLGKYRKQAISENANQVFYYSLLLLSEYADLKDHRLDTQTHTLSKIKTPEDNIFYQRVQLLAVMTKTMERHRFINNFRKKALTDNLNKICETLVFNFKINDTSFLKMA